MNTMTFFGCSAHGPALMGCSGTSNHAKKETDSKKNCSVDGVYFIRPFIKSTVLSSSHFAPPICLRAILPSRDIINVTGTP
jgi:hypothetical protein